MQRSAYELQENSTGPGDEIHYKNMTPDEQDFFDCTSSQITPQELCRQHDL
jgi:hypothetical protein